MDTAQGELLMYMYLFFYMARDVMILMRANPLQRPLEGLGPKETFLGPEMATSKASATWAQKSQSVTGRSVSTSYR